MRRLSPVICAYDRIYLERAQKIMGNMLDIAVNEYGLVLKEFYARFISSRCSDDFSKGDTSTVAGKTGKELFADVMEFDKDKEYERLRSIQLPMNKSPEYWTGWLLTYYQWTRGVSFRTIDIEIPIDRILRMYNPYHEMDITQAVDELNRIRQQNRIESYLKLYRKQRGYTQSELSEATGIPLKTIQQYEQRRKNINKASVDSIIVLSNILKCSPIDLME